MRTFLKVAAAAVLALTAAPAGAEVKLAADGRIELQDVAVIDAPPDKVYAAIGQLGDWWDPAHSYGGRMSLDLKAGGCFCEALKDGGGVKHGEVVTAMPGRLVRLSAPLGPLQDLGVSAALTFDLKPAEGGRTQVTLSYRVGGVPAALLPAAPGIDAVVGGQLVRLKAYAETGKPS